MRLCASLLAHFSIIFLQVVERFTGHGIGADMHMYPHVFHVPTGNRLLMQPGITFTIEPMVTAGNASLCDSDSVSAFMLNVLLTFAL
jgi:methionine aminopeptidase